MDDYKDDDPVSVKCSFCSTMWVTTLASTRSYKLECPGCGTKCEREPIKWVFDKSDKNLEATIRKDVGGRR